jgi:hypothetical protein
MNGLKEKIREKSFVTTDREDRNKGTYVIKVSDLLHFLEEATKQIQEKASDTLLWHKPTNSTVRLLESYVKLSEVLAILDGKEKAKPT